MNIDTLRGVVNVLQMAVILFCLVKGFGSIRGQPQPMLTLFFSLGLLCLFVSDLYWVVHGAMGKGVYLPFSACDLGTIGFYLLLAAALDTVFRGKAGDVQAVAIAAIVFAAANAAIWIAWSGRVFQNALGGAAFAYLLFSAARALKRSEALSLRGWEFLAAAGIALIGVNLMLLHLSGGAYYAVNLLNYGILFGYLAFFFIRTVRALSGDDADTALALAFSGFSWNFVTSYLSDEPYYTVSDFFVMFFVVMMLMAVRRKAAEA